MRALGAVPYWLDVPESTYRSGPFTTAALTQVVVDFVDRLKPDALLIPLGLKHPDHLTASEIGFDVVRAMEPRPWMVYSDFYQVAHPHLVPDRLAQLAGKGITLRPTYLPLGPIRTKRLAIRCYRSQKRGFGGRLDRWGSKASEELWAPI
jgi:LmbE family N-acetylglucosaminyl deacetylase